MNRSKNVGNNSDWNNIAPACPVANWRVHLVQMQTRNEVSHMTEQSNPKQRNSMATERKKQLAEEYKNRMPEMGVISFRCIATNQVFLGVSKDTRADFNSLRFKLTAGGYPNKQLQTLWKQYGESGFEITVAKALKYENPHDDHSEELEKLREQCMLENPQAEKIWR